MPSRTAPRPAVLTLNDVARALDVSRTTVSNAFNRPGQLSPALREQILARAHEMGYFGPQLVARAMRRRELREVGVVFHHDIGWALNDPTALGFLKGVAAELDPRGLSLQIIPEMGRKEALAAAFQTTADALIVHAEVGPEFAPQLQASVRPVVLVDAPVPGVPTVRIDDRGGAATAMRHVLAARPDHVLVLLFPMFDDDLANLLARRRMPATGYVGGERMAGALQALRDAGFPLERVQWLPVDDRLPEAAAERVAALRNSLPPRARVAVVGMSDRLALAALGVARRWRGIELVAAVGFDDIPAAAAAGLTTVRQDFVAKGRLAVRVVLDAARPSRLPVELVVRDT